MLRVCCNPVIYELIASYLNHNRPNQPPLQFPVFLPLPLPVSSKITFHRFKRLLFLIPISLLLSLLLLYLTRFAVFSLPAFSAVDLTPYVTCRVVLVSSVEVE